ncbi:hypothetical protein B0H21DRAFT_715752 [Amylocystis lapponica]|nr:hypothetical protein B0H21DRAFT_715752 [Amylocystis lapponica]
MATPGAASMKNLAEGGAEALQALLESISPGSSSSVQKDKKPTAEQVRKLSDKLSELLGDEADGPVQTRNKKGELLNEEGLPIIDIVEPLSDPAAAPSSEPIHVFDDPDLLPFWALSPAEKARRRAERDRILDLLEDEERVQQERDTRAERERWQAELERRKEAANAEMDGIRKARELQKKMGKALLRNVVDAKEKEEEAVPREKEQQGEGSKPRKNVTFADTPGEDTTDSEIIPSLGDVSLGRLERKPKDMLTAISPTDNQPMKMNVVERHPRNADSPSSIRVDLSKFQDSDDESVPGSPVPADSDEGEIIHSDSSDEEDHLAASHLPSDPESTDVELDDDEPVAWQDDDFDFAQHQREIALAYYEKRATIGAEASSAMKAHSHNEDENEWNQPEVPLEATLASAQPKPSLSRFKSERLSSNSVHSLASHSLGPSVLPSSQSSSLKRAVRMGKFEDGKLVGQAEDSEDEGEREAKEIWDLLTRGEVQNAGPQTGPMPKQTAGEAALAAPPLASSSTGQQTILPHAETPSTPSKSKTSRVSKFKLAIAQTRGPEHLGPSSSSPSAQNTPISFVERSSPKVTTSELGTPIAAPSSSSRFPLPQRNAPSKRPSTTAPPSSPVSASVQKQIPSMIVDSPSFRPPTISRSSTSSPLRGAPIVNSPHLGSQSSITVVDSPPFASVVIDSPSFRIPNATPPMTRSPIAPPPALSEGTATTAASNPARTVENSVFERPAVVMTADVKEASGTRGGGTNPPKERRVSRFLADRL